MGDMAEPWKSMRLERQKQVASGERVSMRFKTDADREWHTEAQHEANSMVDADNMKRLTKLGLSPIYKSTSSFQINFNGRIGMYYDGKRGEQIRWNDGEVKELHYHELEEYVAPTSNKRGQE